MNRKQKTILLVEDQIVAAAPAIKALKNAGYDVIYVMNGENAVIISEADVHLDLVVMDIELGSGICGITASKMISSIRGIPILFFTSQSAQYIKERIDNSLSVNYLSKTNPLRSLIVSIDSILSSVDLLKNMSELKEQVQ